MLRPYVACVARQLRLLFMTLSRKGAELGRYVSFRFLPLDSYACRAWPALKL